MGTGGKLERVKGIEHSYSTWKFSNFLYCAQSIMGVAKERYSCNSNDLPDNFDGKKHELVHSEHFDVPPNQITAWKDQLEGGASGVPATDVKSLK